MKIRLVDEDDVHEENGEIYDDDGVVNFDNLGDEEAEFEMGDDKW